MLTPAQRAVIEGSPRAGRGATPGEFEERRRALTGVMASARQVIWA